MSLSEVMRCFKRQHARAALLMTVALAALVAALNIRDAGELLAAVGVYLTGFAVATFAIKVELGVLQAVQAHNRRCHTAAEAAT